MSGLHQPNQQALSMDDKRHRVSILVEILNTPGSLLDVLKYFWKNDIDLTCIESRPTSADSSAFMVYIDFAGIEKKFSHEEIKSHLYKDCVVETLQSKS